MGVTVSGNWLVNWGYPVISGITQLGDFTKWDDPPSAMIS